MFDGDYVKLMNQTQNTVGSNWEMRAVVVQEHGRYMVFGDHIPTGQKSRSGETLSGEINDGLFCGSTMIPDYL